MRILIALAALLLVPSLSLAQTEKVVEELERKLATIRYVQGLQDKETGAFKASADAKGTSLRATSAAVRALKYQNGKPAIKAVPNAARTAAFVMSCFDPKTGGFADSPGGKLDVALTAVGVMAAMELEIPKDKFAKAMDYLKENAKTFEDVRIGAAAVEAWGVKDCPFKLEEWHCVATVFARPFTNAPIQDPERARELASFHAFMFRLNPGTESTPAFRKDLATPIIDGQRADGGWGPKDVKTSDLETTYRVMRALMLLEEKPKDVAKLREFIAKCRNKDGGYGVKPGEASSASGVYFATIIAKWLDDMEKKY